jgi:lipid-A-disaccharide synthase
MPVDSPSANYPLCARLKPLGARVVNLVAPQLWAWAPWRIGKVRRLTDVLLCLLPFEEEWFRTRGVTAKYIGHPVLSKPLDHVRLAAEAAILPAASPRLLLLPGSRSSEVRRNGRLLADVFALIRAQLHGARAVAVASNEANAARFLEQLGGSLPSGVDVVVSGRELSLEGALAWCDLALAVSGTVSLDCTRQAKPVIGVYRTSLAEALGARLVIRAPNLLLPNILAGRRIVPEFVPYAGGPERIARDATDILRDDARRERMTGELRAVADTFLGRDPAPIAAEVVAREARGVRVGNDALDEFVRAFS